MVRNAPDAWEEKEFKEVFDQDLAAPEIRQQALYPVVDQSKRFIAGYDKAGGRTLLKGDAVVFGDHTREIKYIPEDFLPQGDGVRVLYGKNDESRFLAYYIAGIIQVPNTGYNRHFKYLIEHKYRLPNRQEQQAIANVLAGFDEHLTNLDELIRKKKAIRDAAVEELVSGSRRLGTFSAPWESRGARELLSDVITGGTPSTKVEKYWDGDIPWLSSTEIHHQIITQPTRNISADGLENSSAQIAPAGSVLIALAGQGKTRGTTAFLMRDMAINQSLAALIANEDVLNNAFLLYNLTRRYGELRGMSSGDGGRGGLNKTLLWNLRFVLPSSLEEQRMIADVLSRMDEEIRLLRKERAKVECLKLGAMEDLLTGRVRLPVSEETG